MLHAPATPAVAAAARQRSPCTSNAAPRPAPATARSALAPVLRRQQPCTLPAQWQPLARVHSSQIARAASDQAMQTDTLSDQEEWVWTEATTRITIFSAAQYVERYMREPLEAAGFANLNFIDTRLDRSTAALAAGSPVVCLFVNDICDKHVVKRLAAAGVRMIAMRCAGYDRVDIKACEEYGIHVARVPTYSPTSVAEHAVGLMFALNRHLNLAYTRVLAGNYSLGPLVGMELKGKKVGVLGTGAIGTEAVRLFKGIGMEVMAYDVRANPAVEQMGVPYMSVEEILPQADVVSLHVPLLPSTYQIINKPRLAMMKPGCMLINVSRGGLIDSDELMAALETGRVGAVGLDVYENEGDMFFVDWSDFDLATRMKAWDRKFKALTSYPQVIVTPHSAFLTNEALANIAGTTVENITSFLAGQPMRNALTQLPPPDRAGAVNHEPAAAAGKA